MTATGLEPKTTWFVYELSGCGFESRCSHLNFKYCACFEQEVPLHSGNYRMWIHSETRTWHDKNIQLHNSTWIFHIFSRRWGNSFRGWPIQSKGQFLYPLVFRSFQRVKKWKIDLKWVEKLKLNNKGRTRRIGQEVFWKKGVLKNFKNSQENTYARVWEHLWWLLLEGV